MLSDLRFLCAASVQEIANIYRNAQRDPTTETSPLSLRVYRWVGGVGVFDCADIVVLVYLG